MPDKYADAERLRPGLDSGRRARSVDAAIVAGHRRSARHQAARHRTDLVADGPLRDSLPAEPAGGIDCHSEDGHAVNRAEDRRELVEEEATV
jgi:hypothetical protein